MKKIHIGTSGWSYQHWDKVFYVDSSNRLEFYSKHFKTVEVNTTFYHLPSEETIKNWFKQVPKSFVFSIKASRYITHIKRLNDCKASLELFYKRIESLGKKLGPILFQLPPSFKKNIERLEAFIALLKPGQRHTFEFRSDTWFDEEVYSLLKKHNIALCFSDLNGKLSPLEITADFVYIRMHGPIGAYGGSYGKRRLLPWIKRINQWKKTVFVYFDNDEKGYAVKDALTLLKLL